MAHLLMAIYRPTCRLIETPELGLLYISVCMALSSCALFNAQSLLIQA